MYLTNIPSLNLVQIKSFISIINTLVCNEKAE